LEIELGAVPVGAGVVGAFGLVKVGVVVWFELKRAWRAPDVTPPLVLARPESGLYWAAVASVPSAAISTDSWVVI
jgi:hypothetical protein